MSRHDRSDPDRRTVVLTRAIHHVWAEKRRIRRYLDQERVIHEALETLFQAKREVKAQIAKEKAELSERIQARLMKRALLEVLH